MSGMFAQFGAANETVVPPAATAGTSVAATIGGYPFVNTLTFGTPHGLQVGSVLTITGYTPAAWNGTFVVATVPSSTTLTFLSAVSLATATVFGTISASLYGVYATPTRFWTFLKESFKLNAARIESVGVGANRRVQSSTRGVVDRQGGAGDLELEVESKGFGFWLKHLVGPVVTTGPTDSAYTHAASLPTGGPPGMLGTSATLQGTVVPPGGLEMVKTILGAKCTAWEFDFAVGQLLTLKASFDYMDEQVNVAKAVAAYASNPELFSFAGATVTIGGTVWDVVNKGAVKCDLGYNTNRRFARGNTLQKEPAEEKFRTITIDLDGEFDNLLTVYNRYAAAAYANTIATISIAFVGKILIGATTYPSLTFTFQVARIDGDTPTTDGPALPMQHLTAKVLWDQVNSPVVVSYVTTDSAP